MVESDWFSSWKTELKLTGNFAVSDEIDEIILSREWITENDVDWKFCDTLYIRGRRVELKPAGLR